MYNYALFVVLHMRAQNQYYGWCRLFSEAFRMLRIGASWFSSVEGVPDGVRRCIFHGRGTMGNHETGIPRGAGAALPGKAECFRERSGTGWERMS